MKIFFAHNRITCINWACNNFMINIGLEGHLFVGNKGKHHKNNFAQLKQFPVLCKLLRIVLETRDKQNRKYKGLYFAKKNISCFFWSTVVTLAILYLLFLENVKIRDARIIFSCSSFAKDFNWTAINSCFDLS